MTHRTQIYKKRNIIQFEIHQKLNALKGKNTTKGSENNKNNITDKFQRNKEVYNYHTQN